ncbi:MAG: sugar ABC transporter substrate-binding protein [Candidatus Omnitrophica bacterium]|nr:sugar ABC transporter substrate-binding protein [Candidatus Omnitrophota bacterium]
MKQRRVILLSLVLAAFFSFSVTGCSKKVSDASKPVEIRVAFWGAPDEVNIMENLIAGWQARHPEILVRLEHTPYRGYVDKLLTRIAGRAAPDIICTEVDLFVTFQTKGVLLDLNPYIKDDPDFDIKAFYPEIIGRFTVDGKLYSIPRDTAPFACVYYNKKLFDAAGVPYPKDDWDMNDMLDKAKKLTKLDPDGRVVQYGFYAWAWQNFVYSFGGSLVDKVKDPAKCTLDSKESIAGLQFYSDLINKYKVHPSSITMTDLAMGVQGMFATGRLAMFASGIWETPGLRKVQGFDWDVAMFPKGPRGIRAFGTGGSGYCILKGTAHPKEAYQVVKALTCKDAQAMLADTGLAQPAIIEIANGPHWIGGDLPPKNKKMLNDAMKYVIYEPFHPAWREAKEMYILPELDLVFGGKKTVQDAVKSFMNKVNALLKDKSAGYR